MFQFLKSLRSTAGLPDFSWFNIPKWEKIYQMTIQYTRWPQNIPDCRKIDQVSIKFTSIFHYKTLQNSPKFGFLVWKYTIWHPCSTERLENAAFPPILNLKTYIHTWQPEPCLFLVSNFGGCRKTYICTYIAITNIYKALNGHQITNI
jgi:hypothetical protein